MKVKPLNDRILIQIEKVSHKTTGGLYIPETAQVKTEIGIVKAIGDDKEIKVITNDKIMYDKYAGTPVSVDGVDCLILKISDVLAILE